jgi:hypothetical protein
VTPISIISQRSCNHCARPFDGADSFVCNPCLDASFAPFDFTLRGPAKSSAVSMATSVCQECGHNLDGRRASKEGCSCGCHR